MVLAIRLLRWFRACPFHGPESYSPCSWCGMDDEPEANPDGTTTPRTTLLDPDSIKRFSMLNELENTSDN